MAKVILDMAISLDGFIAGPPDKPERLHDWYFEPQANSVAIIDELLATTGAIVMGRVSYDLADKYDAYIENPYKVPHFVLSHTVPEKLAQGTTQFIFVTDGIESVIEKAKVAAGDKYVAVGGGADIAQQCLQAGLVDEIQLHIVSVMFGGGIRLFDQLASNFIELEQIRVIESVGVSHLRYRVVK